MLEPARAVWHPTPAQRAPLIGGRRAQAVANLNDRPRSKAGARPCGGRGRADLAVYVVRDIGGSLGYRPRVAPDRDRLAVGKVDAIAAGSLAVAGAGHERVPFHGWSMGTSAQPPGHDDAPGHWPDPQQGPPHWPVQTRQLVASGGPNVPHRSQTV